MAEIPNSYGNFLTPALIQAEQDKGKGLLNATPTPRPYFTPSPSLRNRVQAALGAFGQGVQASQGFNRGQAAPDAFGSFLAGATGGLGAPSAQDIAAAEAKRNAEVQMAQLESTPIDDVSPDLVATHPELKGIPLGMINKLAPFIQRADKATRVISRPMAENIAKAQSWMTPQQQAELANRISGMDVEDARLMIPAEPRREQNDTTLTDQEQNAIGKSMRGEKLSQADLKGLRPQVLAQLSLKPIPLSAESAKASANALSGIQQINVALNVLKGGKSGKMDIFAANMKPGWLGDTAASMFGSEKAQTLRTAVKEAGDVITRLRTGAALNTQEEKYYGNLLLGFMRGDEGNINSLTVVQNFLKNVENQVRNGRRIPGLVEGGQPTFVEGEGPILPSATQETPDSIKAEYRAGRLTKEQAKEKLKAGGF